MAVLLIYNIDGRELKRLKTFCTAKSVRARLVRPEEYGEPLGALCGEAGRTGAAPGEENIGRMLVFSGFGERQLDAFLEGLRTARLAADAIKAAATAYNIAWDSCRLWRALLQERSEISGGGT